MVDIFLLMWYSLHPIHYNQIQLMQTFAKEKGYPSCYIVAFKEGEKFSPYCQLYQLRLKVQFYYTLSMDK